MRHFTFVLAFIAAIFLLVPATSAEEETPLDAYKTYTEAVQAGDREAAYDSAARAYELALSQWGDTRKETGLLASNYALLLSNRKEYANARDVYRKCEEVLVKYLPDTMYDAANCQLQYGFISIFLKKESQGEDAFLRLIDITDSAYEENKKLAELVADAYLALAGLNVPEKVKLRKPDQDFSRKLEKTRDYALKALAALRIAHEEDNIDTARAYYFLAQYQESKRDFDAAYLEYEKAYNIRQKLLGEEDELTKRSYGRFVYTRAQAQNASGDFPGGLKFNDDCAQKEQAGEIINVCIKRRQPPKFPDAAANAGRYGFARVQYDIGVDGNTKNARIHSSWPEAVFDKSSLNAVKGWKYSIPVNKAGAPREVTGIHVFFIFELAV